MKNWETFEEKNNIIENSNSSESIQDSLSIKFDIDFFKLGLSNWEDNRMRETMSDLTGRLDC